VNIYQQSFETRDGAKDNKRGVGGMNVKTKNIYPYIEN
jgi:hypothetical protein